MSIAKSEQFMQKLKITMALVALVTTAGNASAYFFAYEEPPQIFVSANSGADVYAYYSNGTEFGSSPLLSGLTDANNLAVYDGDLFVGEGGSIAEYNEYGSPISTSLISGLTNPNFTISSGVMYVTNYSTGVVGAYTLGSTPGTITSSTPDLFTVSGGTLNGIAVSGSDIFVANETTNTVGEYTTSGGTITPTLITGLSDPLNLALTGSSLFVDSDAGGGGTIGAYTLGSTPGTISSSNAALYSYLGFSSNPSGLALSGTNILTVLQNNAAVDGGDVGSYAQNGASSDSSFISGLTDPQGLAVDNGEQAVPEPSTWALMAAGVALLAISRRQLRRN
jgi:hypothetical protein